MKQFSRILIAFLQVAVAAASAGCGTVRTMPTLADYGGPKIYSGTRLDFYAVTGNEPRLGDFSVKPPLLDMPFSFVLDTVILPVILPVAT